MSNGLQGFLSFLFDPIIDFFRAGRPKPKLKEPPPVVQVGQYHVLTVADPTVGTLTPPRAVKPQYAGWLGRVIAHGIMVQNFFFNYLLKNLHTHWDKKFSDQSTGKVWSQKYAEFPPPQWAGGGQSLFWNYHFLRQCADNTWHPGGLMHNLVKSWCQNPIFDGYHFCGYDAVPFRNNSNIIFLPMDKRSGPKPGDPCKAKIEATDPRLRRLWLEWGLNFEDMLNCRIQYFEHPYERGIYEYYSQSMWLVWAAEMWRMHSRNKIDDIPWSWISHCLQWGIGCASGDRRRRIGELSRVGLLKPGEKPRTNFRVNSSSGEVWHILSNIMRETPPPGSIRSGTELDGRLCPFPVRAGIARPATGWPVTMNRIAPIEDFHETDWRDVLWAESNRRMFASGPLRWAKAMQKIVTSVTGAQVGQALTGSLSSLIGVSLDELMSTAIGTIYSAGKSYLPTDVLDLGNPFEIIKRLKIEGINIDVPSGKVLGDYLNVDEVVDEITDMNRTWNRNKNYAVDLIGDFTEDPRVQSAFDAIK